jgi:hypothetical protein
MHGHTDFGLTTLLFSVPISCLQIWGRDEKYGKVHGGSSPRQLDNRVTERCPRDSRRVTRGHGRTESAGFNWYRPDWNDITRVPTCLHPFMDEIEEFANYLTTSGRDGKVHGGSSPRQLDNRVTERCPRDSRRVTRISPVCPHASTPLWMRSKSSPTI